MASIGRVTVLGAGTMGGGIATLLLQSGLHVAVYDVVDAAREAAAVRIAKRNEAADVATRLRLTGDLEEAVTDADFVIEAAPEQLELKRRLFAEVDRLAPAGAILASNTSELSLTAIAAATGRPDRVIGMHWFNPPERMALVEIVRALQTSDATLEATRALAQRCGKTTVTVADRQGFVTTRAVAALLLEGVRMLEEGVAGAEDIDTAVKLGLNHPMGPLELSDYIGLDTMLLIAESLAEALGERFRPPQTLRKLVEAGRLGRKSGRGFYDYGEG
ncbi:MAG: 3-hydroxyacyl-CoA dehydrogenase family protein [Deinococcales bacterium]